LRTLSINIKLGISNHQKNDLRHVYSNNIELEEQLE